MSVIPAVAEILAAAMVLVKDLGIVHLGAQQREIRLRQKLFAKVGCGTNIITGALRRADAADLNPVVRTGAHGSLQSALVVFLLQKQRHRLDALSASLRALHPDAVLERGYAIVRREGRIVGSVAALRAGACVIAQLRDGEFEANITAIAPKDGEHEKEDHV